MCGIAGLFAATPRADLGPALRAMTTAAAHRGPDDEGAACFSGGAPVAPVAPCDAALGHRRLSILDLSPAGHQPMASADGRRWIVYNGEIYNYVELRRELAGAGARFRSQSDTEVILAAYAAWGDDCLRRLRGMWGFALLDLERRRVLLARDRVGIKPLYLWRGEDIVAAVSEIKQLRHAPGFGARADRDVVLEYLRTGYEDPTRSFFAGVEPVPGGTYRVLELDGLRLSEARSFWDPERIEPRAVAPAEAARVFRAKLEDAVEQHLRSDVPVGCALSGGLDSSALAVLMRRAAPDGDLHAFSVTFPGETMDESAFARIALAAARATPHTVTPAPAEFLADLDAFVLAHDEPVGTLAMYAGYRLARLTRASGIKVTLNGQGGDEALSGYWQSYFMHLRALARGGHPLRVAGHFLGALLPGGNPALWPQVPWMLRRYLHRRRAGAALPLRRDADASHGGVDGASILRAVLTMSEQQRRVYELRRLFLPRLLKWDDRSSMAFGVEGRYPFLDHELLELALAFPPDVLYARGFTKRPLRDGLRGVLPDPIRLRRSKFGFEVPQEAWLAGPLRPTLETWLAADRPIWDVLDRDGVRGLLPRDATARLGGGDERAQLLFRAFMVDRWAEVFGVGL